MPSVSGGCRGRAVQSRNAALEIVVVNYESAVQQITRIANGEHGFIATNNSSKQANGKRQGTVVGKVPPEKSRLFSPGLRALDEPKLKR